jgi:hypothetical protein
MFKKNIWSRAAVKVTSFLRSRLTLQANFDGKFKGTPDTMCELLINGS